MLFFINWLEMKIYQILLEEQQQWLEMIVVCNG